jgi:hypothetical protein
VTHKDSIHSDNRHSFPFPTFHIRQERHEKGKGKAEVDKNVVMSLTPKLTACYNESQRRADGTGKMWELEM